MKPLNESYKLLVLCLICPPYKPLNSLIKARNIFVSIVIFLIQALTLIGSSIYFVRNFTTDLTNSLSALFQVAGLWAGLFIQTNGFRVRKRFEETFNAFQTFYDLSKYSRSSQIFYFSIFC